MKLTRIIILLVLTITSGNLLSEVTILSYRGWNNCYLIKNKTCELIICPEAGGRVLKYALNGKNAIFENSEFNGRLLADFQEKRSVWPDGGRFDIGPESMPGKLHDHIYMGKWVAIITGNMSVKMTCPTPNDMGIEVTREFILSSKGTKLQINQTMKNYTNSAIRRHFWNRTFCPAGGIVTLPVDKKSIQKNGYRLMNDTTVDVSQRLISSKGKLQFKTIQPTIKMGTDSKKGWMTYMNNGLMISMFFNIDSKGDYSDTDNNTTIFYSNGVVVELEPVSPTFNIKPNGIVWFKQTWELK
jgi:hypothetical protein